MPDTDMLRRAALLALDHTAGQPATPEELWSRLVRDGWRVVERFDAEGWRYLIVAPAGGQPLSARERLVVASAARGDANKAIAIDLGMPIGSVSSTLSAALRKMGLGSRLDLVALARLVADVEVA